MPDENRPLPRDEETKPVAWTPEDASRFLTSAIHEAQRPLGDALKQRPITSKWLTIIVVLLVFGAAVIALILSSQLEKAEKRMEEARQAREDILTEKAEIQARAHILEDRLTSARSTLSSMQDNEGELRRAKSDLQRSRRHAELLRNQIAGLEMEKMALARQLEAVKAMAIDDDYDPDSEDANDEATGEKPTAPHTHKDASLGEPREDTDAVLPGEGFPESAKAADVTPEPEAPAPPAATTEPAAPAIEAPGSEIPASPAGKLANATAKEPDEEPPAAATALEDTSPAIGADHAASGKNPLTLYEASQLFDTTAARYGESLAEAVREAQEQAAVISATTVEAGHESVIPDDASPANENESGENEDASEAPASEENAVVPEPTTAY